MGSSRRFLLTYLLLRSNLSLTEKLLLYRLMRRRRSEDSDSSSSDEESSSSSSDSETETEEAPAPPAPVIKSLAPHTESSGKLSKKKCVPDKANNEAPALPLAGGRIIIKSKSAETPSSSSRTQDIQAPKTKAILQRKRLNKIENEPENKPTKLSKK